MEQLTTDRFFTKSKKQGGNFWYDDTNATVACECSYNSMNDERLFGKEYRFFDQCIECNGYGKVLEVKKVKNPITNKKEKVAKWVQCKECRGVGIFPKDEPIIVGPCPKCGGTMKLDKVSIDDPITLNDIVVLITLTTFKNLKKSDFITFQEKVNNINGIINLKKYQGKARCAESKTRLLKPSYILEDVLEYFLTHRVPYRIFLDKDKKLCNNIQLKFTDKEWVIIPEWLDEILCETKKLNRRYRTRFIANLKEELKTEKWAKIIGK